MFYAVVLMLAHEYLNLDIFFSSRKPKRAEYLFSLIFILSLDCHLV